MELIEVKQKNQCHLPRIHKKVFQFSSTLLWNSLFAQNCFFNGWLCLK